MARCAGGRVSGANVIWIVRAVVIGRVAAVTIGGHGRKIVVHVAAGAGNGHMKAGQWKCGFAVIEHRTRPARGRVAGVAGDREARRRVRGIIRRVVVGQMAGLAGRVGQPVVVADMTGRAEDSRVEAGQREAGARMVPRRGRPIHGVVAKSAIQWVARRSMGRIVGPVVIRRMACLTRRVGQRIIIVDVA